MLAAWSLKLDWPIHELASLVNAWGLTLVVLFLNMGAWARLIFTGFLLGLWRWHQPVPFLKKSINARRNIHLKLIYPNTPCNLYTDYPEAVPDMLRQFS